ncbi:MAG: hypothetical protein DSZ28_09665 [Thiothrix sp.]|nr:MAG: hypothetical protein DSZ28_09665 [Thiothrix sp.]
MKVKKVAVTAAVCAALLGSQGVMAEEQAIGAEGMGFAFDDAQVFSVQMSELSGSEMDATEGAVVGNLIGGGVSIVTAGATYYVTSPNPNPGGAAAAMDSAAVGGFVNPGASVPIGIEAGSAAAIPDAVNTSTGYSPVTNDWNPAY